MNSSNTYQAVMEANIDFHNTLAETYRTCEPHFRPENISKVEEKLLKIINDTKAKKLLDLGCGTGFIIDIAKKYVSEIHGVDITLKMLEQIDRSGPAKITTFQCDTGAFTAEPENYDLATAYSFLHHLYDIVPTLKTAFKALKHGGKFYVDLEPNFYLWQDIYKLERDDSYDPIVNREIEMVKFKDEDFKKNFGLPKQIVDYAEYGKNILGGFKEEELMKILKNIGFSQVDFFYYWYIGQGAIINDNAKEKSERFKNAEIIDELLKRVLPLSRNLYKYIGFIATK